ncbi:MAG: phosphate signaling complex protein PhoU, partial [Myxococcales bacterium]
MAIKKHTDKTYDSELDDLRHSLIQLGGKVESEIAQSVRALTERDSDLANQVLAADREVNRLEITIDEMCRRLLALRQPAASDLRLITTALKIVVDLERMGDLAVNIAERAIDLSQSPPLPPVHDLTKLAQLCQNQL